MNGPWTDGPRELIQHTVDHLDSGGDFDRRVAMTSGDHGKLLKTYQDNVKIRVSVDLVS